MSNDNGSSKWEEMAKVEQEQNEEQAAVIQEEDHQALEDSEQYSGQEESASLEHPDYEALQKQLTEAEAKAHENWEKAVRATAEMENIRRRAERDVENAHKFGEEKLIKSLLPIMDSLEQALQAAETASGEGLDSMKQGIELTIKLFIDTLEKAKVTQIDPVGDTFDPQRHEAMSMQETPDAKSGTVLMVFQKGYALNERVIRPARVIVAK
jgi:molecular chaperone GrpE